MFGGIGVAWLLGLIVFFLSVLALTVDIVWRLLRKIEVKPTDGWPWLFQLMSYVGMAFGGALCIIGLWVIHYLRSM